MSRNQEGASARPKRGKVAVRPDSLNKFLDALPVEAMQRARAPSQPPHSKVSGAFGSAKRSSLTDQKNVMNVPTQNGNLGGAFDRADYKKDVFLPRTEAQRILHRDHYDAQEDEIYVVVPEKWTIGGVVPPTNKKLKIPKVHSEYLMTPQQRRELYAFEFKKREAEKLGKKAKADREQMKNIIKTTYPNGVIGLESVEPKYGEKCPNLYAGKLQSASKNFAKAARAQEARKQNIIANSDSLQRRGYKFIHQDTKAPPQGAIAARKGGARPAFDTHSRLFSRDKTTFNAARAQALRQQDTRGRRYDLITGEAK